MVPDMSKYVECSGAPSKPSHRYVVRGERDRGTSLKWGDSGVGDGELDTDKLKGCGGEITCGSEYEYLRFVPAVQVSDPRSVGWTCDLPNVPNFKRGDVDTGDWIVYETTTLVRQPMKLSRCCSRRGCDHQSDECDHKVGPPKAKASERLGLIKNHWSCTMVERTSDGLDRASPLTNTAIISAMRVIDENNDVPDWFDVENDLDKVPCLNANVIMVKCPVCDFVEGIDLDMGGYLFCEVDGSKYKMTHYIRLPNNEYPVGNFVQSGNATDVFRDARRLVSCWAFGELWGSRVHERMKNYDGKFMVPPIPFVVRYTDQVNDLMFSACDRHYGFPSLRVPGGDEYSDLLFEDSYLRVTQIKRLDPRGRVRLQRFFEPVRLHTVTDGPGRGLVRIRLPGRADRSAMYMRAPFVFEHSLLFYFEDYLSLMTSRRHKMGCRCAFCNGCECCECDLRDVDIFGKPIPPVKCKCECTCRSRSTARNDKILADAVLNKKYHNENERMPSSTVCKYYKDTILGLPRRNEFNPTYLDFVVRHNHDHITRSFLGVLSVDDMVKYRRRDGEVYVMESRMKRYALDLLDRPMPLDTIGYHFAGYCKWDPDTVVPEGGGIPYTYRDSDDFRGVPVTCTKCGSVDYIPWKLSDRTASGLEILRGDVEWGRREVVGECARKNMLECDESMCIKIHNPAIGKQHSAYGGIRMFVSDFDRFYMNVITQLYPGRVSEICHDNSVYVVAPWVLNPEWKASRKDDLRRRVSKQISGTCTVRGRCHKNGCFGMSVGVLRSTSGGPGRFRFPSTNTPKVPSPPSFDLSLD